MIDPARLREAARRLLPRVIEVRRHLHAHPERSFEEHATAAFLAERLAELGLPFRRVAGTGLEARIDGRAASGPTVALRADIDALPIAEKNETEYRSRNDGVMHACGHDAHAAALLGAATLLADLRSEFGGSVRLLFQPGEERVPGGASLMIREGVLRDPVPAAILGQHVFPELPAGQVGFRSGRYMASTDELYLTVVGKGGHGGLPGQCVNPILVAAEIVTELEARFMNVPQPVPTVLAFGRIEGLGATNVIPDVVTMQGTFRTMDEERRARAHEELAALAASTARRRGAECRTEIRPGYPCLVNDEALTARARAAAEEYLGSRNVVELDVRMTSEDFAWYARHVPGCFYRLGTASRNGRFRQSVHRADFDIDEGALETGAGLLAWIAVRELGR